MNGGYDLAVVGLGPAGSALALRMARRGFRVAAVEQHRIPTDKLCGEFLSWDAVAQLSALGVAGEVGIAGEVGVAGESREVSQGGAEPPGIERVRLVVPGAGEMVHPLHPPGLGVSRMRLDGALAAAAKASGVHIMDRWRAVRVEQSGNQAFIVRGIDRDGRLDDLRAREIVLAFGKAEHRIGTDGPPGRGESSDGYIAWKAHHLGAGPRDVVELYAFGGGYCGVAPIEGKRFNVCGLATRAAFARAGSSIDRLVAGAMRENASLRERLERLERLDRHYLVAASMSFRRRRPVTSSCLFLGDAAGLIAPLCGDGIGMAMGSALLAEEWLAPLLEGKIERRAMLAGYRAHWRRAFDRRLLLGSGLQRLLLHPRGSGWALRVCRAAPKLTGWLVRHTREPALPSDRRPVESAGSARPPG